MVACNIFGLFAWIVDWYPLLNWIPSRSLCNIFCLFAWIVDWYLLPNWILPRSFTTYNQTFNSYERATSSDVNLLELHFSFGHPDSWSGWDKHKPTVGKLLSRWTKLWMLLLIWIITETKTSKSPWNVLHICWKTKQL